MESTSDTLSSSKADLTVSCGPSGKTIECSNPYERCCLLTPFYGSRYSCVSAPKPTPCSDSSQCTNPGEFCTSGGFCQSSYVIVDCW
jgi:hypothetical protein